MSALDPVHVLQELRAGPEGASADPPPPAAIREYDAETDLNVARYLIGAQIMEPSSVANQALLLSPVGLALWFAVSALAIKNFTRGIPALPHSSEWHAIARFCVDLLSIFPTFVAPPLVILALAEFRHRNLFEAKMRAAIGEEDLRDIPQYYQSHEGTRSGFWVLEYDKRLIGLVALDARKPGKPLASVTTVAEKEVEAKKAVDQADAQVASSGDGKVIQIRRIAASLSFRPSGIEDDLIEFACKQAFEPVLSKAKPAEKLIVAVRPSLEPGLVRRLRKFGFAPTCEDVVQESSTASSGSILETLWPVNLGTQTLALSSSKWAQRKE